MFFRWPATLLLCKAVYSHTTYSGDIRCIGRPGNFRCIRESVANRLAWTCSHYFLGSLVTEIVSREGRKRYDVCVIWFRTIGYSVRTRDPLPFQI